MLPSAVAPVPIERGPAETCQLSPERVEGLTNEKLCGCAAQRAVGIVQPANQQHQHQDVAHVSVHTSWGHAHAEGCYEAQKARPAVRALRLLQQRLHPLEAAEPWTPE